jgi:RNA polymerase sigma-70 factor, ECF subfamily
VTDPDGALLLALRAGDEAAFATLVRRYHMRLLRLAISLVASPAVAEEVVQDTWLAVVRGIAGFEGRSSVKTWLFRILVNRARSAGAREPRLSTIDGLDDALADRFDASGGWQSPPEPWSDRVDDRIVAAEIAQRVKAGLDELPAGQRQVFVLRDVEGLESSEVCDLLGITDGNQRVLLHRARARVRGMLELEMGRS